MGGAGITSRRDAPPWMNHVEHNHNHIHKPNGDVPDAGLRSLDHYKRALPRWRYQLRQSTLPLIRWETPYLAWMQEKIRSPALDSYFAIAANLGTHTFFMIFLPILFWCGYPAFGKALVHILAAGVFWTGFVKDFYSLPRPLSPPLHRITMSGSAALEYGFPSTHSANAVSVAVFAVLTLRSPANSLSPTAQVVLECVAYFYALSIVFGRLYCGMHGFLDVIVGSMMGAGISLIEFYYGPPVDDYIHSCSWVAPVLIAVITIVMIRIHPEPADDCPCFDDTVAFLAVVIGVEGGTWTYSKIPGDPWETYAFADYSVNVLPLGIVKNILRLVTGVLVVFAWREVTKPALLKLLPHLFRLIEQSGLSLPRRFFIPASEYKSVPPGSRLDNVFPQASDFPRIVESIRNPTKRGRSVSIGPQSAADAYETLAYRERKRRESVGSNSSLRSKPSNVELWDSNSTSAEQGQQGGLAQTTGAQKSQLAQYEQQMGQGQLGMTPSGEEGKEQMYAGNEGELDEKEVFSQIVKSRRRYDVEVVTKLVVYSGIGFLAVCGIPFMFEFVGLGTNHLTTI